MNKKIFYLFGIFGTPFGEVDFIKDIWIRRNKISAKTAIHNFEKKSFLVHGN